jgi:hypothetical protein
LVFAHGLSPGEPRQHPCHLDQLPLAVSLSRTPEHAAIMSPTAATMLATAATIVQNRIVLNCDNLRRVSVYPRTTALLRPLVRFEPRRNLVDLSGSGLVPAKPNTLMCAEGFGRQQAPTPRHRLTPRSLAFLQTLYDLRTARGTRITAFFFACLVPTTRMPWPDIC